MSVGFMSLGLQIAFDALLLGGLYAIGALGFALVWGVLNVLNIAYAAMIMLGAYAAYGLSLWRVDPIVAVPIVMVMMFVFGWLLQRLLLDYVMRGPHSLSIALTYGINLILIGLALYFFTAEYRSVALPDHLRSSVQIAGAHLTYARIVVMLFALGLTALTWWFMDAWISNPRNSSEYVRDLSSMLLRASRVRWLAPWVHLWR
jgi:branched-chain amino acid transport system permease protein